MVRDRFRMVKEVHRILLSYSWGMDKLKRAMQICGEDEPATVEAFQELQRLHVAASTEGSAPTEKEKIGELFEAFYVKCPPDVFAKVSEISSPVL